MEKEAAPDKGAADRSLDNLDNNGNSAPPYLGFSSAKSNKINKAESIRRRQLGDVNKLCLFRWGNTFPEDDEGALGDLQMLLRLYAVHGHDCLLRVISERAPGKTAIQAHLLAEVALVLPRFITPNDLQQAMRLTTEVYEAEKLYHIRPIDMTAEELAEHRRKRSNSKRRERRKRTPRSTYLAKSLSRTKPWEGEGISKATYYRRRGKASDETGVAQVHCGAHTGRSTYNDYRTGKKESTGVWPPATTTSFSSRATFQESVREGRACRETGVSLPIRVYMRHTCLTGKAAKNGR